MPPNNAAGVLPDADLMFLPGKGAATHRVYLAIVQEEEVLADFDAVLVEYSVQYQFNLQRTT